MNFPRAFPAALGALALLLGGCGGLLGGGGRADLYRFGNVAPAPPLEPVPAGAQPALVVFAGSTFERAIEGDRILTTTGAQAGYVAGARWIAPADDLFDAAMRQAFEQRTPAARVVRLRGAPLPDYAIGIDVRRFEADYVGGQEAPPEIVVDARIRLVRWADRMVVADWPVSVRQAAADTRLPSIVYAFDSATTQAVTRIADYAQQTLVSQPRLAQRMPQ